MSKKIFGRLALLLALSMLLAACGGTPGTEPDDETVAEDPASEDVAGGETEPAAAGQCEPGTYKIAYQGPLTGDYAALGENMVRGIELAIKQASEGGELPEGVELEVARFDSQGDPAQAPPLAQQAVADASIVAMVGPAFSGETNAAGPILDEGGLPFISPSATNPDLTEQGWSHFFRTVATDAAQGPIAAKFITDNLGAQSVAVIDDSSDYGKGLADLVEQSLGEMGGEVVLREGVEAGSQDYSAIVGQIAQSGADAVFFGGYYSEAGLIRKQLVDQGAEDITFVSDDGTFDNQFIVVAGDRAAEGSYVTYPGANPQEVDPSFLEAFQSEFDAEPGAFTVEAYQNTLLITEALKNAGCDREAITEFVRDFQGEVFGKEISFNDKGDIATQAYNVFVVEDGQWVLETEVAAPGAEATDTGDTGEATEEASE